MPGPAVRIYWHLPSRQPQLTAGEKTPELAEGTSNDPEIGLRAVAAPRVPMERPEMLQVENARALGWSWPCTHGSRPRPDQTPSPGPPQMPAGKPASQAEEPDDPAAAPTAVPAVAGRTPAPARPPSGTSRFTLHAKKSAGALTPRAQGASRQLRRRRAPHARPRRHEPGGRAAHPVGARRITANLACRHPRPLPAGQLMPPRARSPVGEGLHCPTSVPARRSSALRGPRRARQLVRARAYIRRIRVRPLPGHRALCGSSTPASARLTSAFPWGDGRGA